MKTYISERVYELAKYIVENGATVRSAAKTFCVSKSTVHKDVTERLAECSPALYEEVKKVLDLNLNERHIRGGIATKNKFHKKAPTR